jgi:hypothetical protein
MYQLRKHLIFSNFGDEKDKIKFLLIDCHYLPAKPIRKSLKLEDGKGTGFCMQVGDITFGS